MRRARAGRSAARAAQRDGSAPLPAIALKALLLDAQLAHRRRPQRRGRAALAAAEPLLSPQAPRPASWWHLLRSRLHLVEGRLGDALSTLGCRLRLAQESRIPERWMGVTVMQEGQVQIAAGAFAEAVPFFERAARASSGTQADFCVPGALRARLARLRRRQGDAALGRDRLRAGFALARGLAWIGFLRAQPRSRRIALRLGARARHRERIRARGDRQARPRGGRARTWRRGRGRSASSPSGASRSSSTASAIVFRGKVAKKPIELLQFIIASSGSDVSTATATFALWRELDGDKAKAAFNVALHRLGSCSAATTPCCSSWAA